MTLPAETPTSRCSPQGLEWVLLRLLPVVGVLGIALPAMAALAARWFITGGAAEELAKRVQVFDFWMVGFITVFWMFFMLALVGCVIAWVVRQRKESA
jgi:cell division protein FtsX